MYPQRFVTASTLAQMFNEDNPERAIELDDDHAIMMFRGVPLVVFVATEPDGLDLDWYGHLTTKQRQQIAAAAAEIYSAGDGVDEVPGDEAAEQYVGESSIAHLLGWDREGIEDRIDFDPETGVAWGSLDEHGGVYRRIREDRLNSTL